MILSPQQKIKVTLRIEYTLNYNMSKFGRKLTKNKGDTISERMTKVTKSRSKISKKIQNQNFHFDCQYHDNKMKSGAKLCME